MWPDIVIWSDEAKMIILIELTTLWEDGCEEALESKATKYQELVQQCRGKGWQVFAPEDGRRQER